MRIIYSDPFTHCAAVERENNTSQTQVISDLENNEVLEIFDDRPLTV